MQNLNALLEDTVTQLGFELVDLELSNRGKLIRLFIDKPEGITIDDCVLVSNQVGNVLAVEHDIDYDRLEVSSPGLDRVLKKEADFVRFAGSKVNVKMRMPIDNRKKLSGVLKGLENNQLVVEVEGQTVLVALSNVDKVRLSPEY